MQCDGARVPSLGCCTRRHILRRHGDSPDVTQTPCLLINIPLIRVTCFHFPPYLFSPFNTSLTRLKSYWLSFRGHIKGPFLLDLRSGRLTKIIHTSTFSILILPWNLMGFRRRNNKKGHLCLWGKRDSADADWQKEELHRMRERNVYNRFYI